MPRPEPVSLASCSNAAWFPGGGSQERADDMNPPKGIQPLRIKICLHDGCLQSFPVTFHFYTISSAGSLGSKAFPFAAVPISPLLLNSRERCAPVSECARDSWFSVWQNKSNKEIFISKYRNVLVNRQVFPLQSAFCDCGRGRSAFRGERGLAGCLYTETSAL